jgi:hypothetical protein
MPAVAPSYRNCTVYMYPSRAHAENGSRVGGCGLIVGVFSKTDPSRFYLHVVTNAHVIDNGNHFVRFNTKDGRVAVIEADPAEWVVSTDDDLAVYPADVPANADFKAIMPDLFIDENCTIDGWPLFLGDDVVMYGRFITHDGQQRNEPVARFGNISMLPNLNATVRVNGRDQLAFLVEGRSHGGFSGSPAFVKLAQPRLMDDSTSGRKGWIPLRFMFLGVDCGHLPFWSQARDQPNAAGDKINDTFTDTNSGISIVIPAWRIERLINDKRLMSERDRIDRTLVLDA